MKNATRKPGRSVVIKTIFATAFVTVFSLFANQVSAQSAPSKDLSVRYMGTIDNQPVVRLEFDNPEQANFYLTLRDEDGTILYSELFRDQKYAKSFQVERADAQKSRYSFILTSAKQKYVQSIEVATNLRTVQDVVITKL